MIVKCEQCGKDFDIPRHVVAIGKGRFCSRACLSVWRTGRPRKEPPEVRIWKHIDKSAGPDACWPWTGWKNDGYGRFSVGAHVLLAHRVVYELTNGSIPDGLLVCHHCDNPACCNPSHLFVGTPKDNVQDAITKGRMCRGERSTRGRLTADQVLAIRAAALTGETKRAIARRFGVSHTAVIRIALRKTWAHI